LGIVISFFFPSVELLSINRLTSVLLRAERRLGLADFFSVAFSSLAGAALALAFPLGFDSDIVFFWDQNNKEEGLVKLQLKNQSWNKKK
jgi:hypothetical protein